VTPRVRFLDMLLLQISAQQKRAEIRRISALPIRPMRV
jgi:hypothetical protein